MILVLLLVAVVLLFLAYFIAAEFEGIAKEKGFDEDKRYFWWCFLLPIFGILMVIALPDRKGMNRIVGAINNASLKSEATTMKEATEELPEI